MIYFIFSLLGLAVVAAEGFVVFSCVVTAGGGYSKVELCFWSLAPAIVCMLRHGNSAYKSEMACQCDVVHGFWIEIWHQAL